MPRPILSRVMAATLLIVLAACHRVPPATGQNLAQSLRAASAAARNSSEAGVARRLLEEAALRTTRAPDRDLLSGHVAARAELSNVLTALAAVRANAGDSTGAVAALDRLLFETGDDGILDSLQRSPRYAALASLPAVRARVDQMRAMRRWRHDSAFFSPYRDTLPVDERVSGVSLAWAEMRYSFVGLGFQGIADLDSVYRATLARVLRPMDTWEYYQEVERMMASVGDNHTDVMELPQPLRRHRAGIPWETRRVQGRVMVVSISSPTIERLGASVGDEILTVDGLTPDEYVRQRVPAHLAPSTPQARDALLYGFRLWQGELGSSVRVHLRSAAGQERDVDLRRGGWTDIRPSFNVEGRRLADGVGYLEINTFGDPRAITLIDSVLATFGEIKGLIVDTRYNSGGAQDAGWHLISQWLDAPYVQREQYTNAYVGIWRAWGGTSVRIPMPERVVTPHATIHRKIPLLWIIGPRTASAAEGVAALVEQTGVGTTIGEPSYGSTGQPILLPLPGGGRARVRVEEERFNDGRVYTRRGVVPQVPVAVTADGLRAGRDEVLEKAVSLMREKMSRHP